MKITVHTKYGVFSSKDQDYTEELYEELTKIVDQLPKAKYFCFDSENGMVFLTEKMIQDSLFVFEK
jgi:outer membrane protein assembly factor BamD (BamD/ComL family)